MCPHGKFLMCSSMTFVQIMNAGMEEGEVLMGWGGIDML